ncbi:MAG TPA: GxxExxY protein [Terriglobales bacterium]|nr:GxxExxY protein [Terriglobales bacterium]
MELNQISGVVIDAARKVHSALGPDLLEHIYRACLAYELRQRGLKVQEEVAAPIVYGSMKPDGAYRMDLAVEDSVIVELKAIEKLAPIHKVQLLSYLRLSGKTLGLILNFNVVHLREGIWRVVNQFEPASSASSASPAV